MVFTNNKKLYKGKFDLNPNDQCKILFGGEVPFMKCVAFCRQKGRYLTAHQLKSKGCLGKQCKFLAKIEDREFWRQRDILKKKKNEQRGKYGF